jgi:isopentenyl diphosphate isomerase/L-lactate dehydrogenase-like FMN-dependent dehydrogenase
LALGADLVGIAGPFLRVADRGDVFAMRFAREITETLRITMFTLGHRSVAELQATSRLVPV